VLRSVAQLGVIVTRRHAVRTRNLTPELGWAPAPRLLNGTVRRISAETVDSVLVGHPGIKG